MTASTIIADLCGSAARDFLTRGIRPATQRDAQAALDDIRNAVGQIAGPQNLDALETRVVAMQADNARIRALDAKNTSPKPSQQTKTMSQPQFKLNPNGRPTASAKPVPPAKPAKPAPVTAYQQFIKISAVSPVQGGIFKLRNRDAIIASMPADAPPIQF